MASCCDPRGCDRFFGERFARRVARRYRKRGLGGTEREMVAFLESAGLEGASVLEVGGGVGELQIELLKRGAERAVNLELSPAYDEEARRLLAEAGLGERVERRLHDIAVDPDAVEPADVVVLNRVVCCYPDYERLLGAAAARARRALVFSFPRRNAVSRAIIAVQNAGFRLCRPGVPRVHPPARGDAGRGAGARARPGLRPRGPRLAGRGVAARVTRIAFIGAGSIEFTRDLLGDLLTFDDLGELHIALHDIDAERLDTAEAMARWTAQQLGARPTFTTHLDRREALDGADFAFNMIQVGGHAATLLDFEIPARHGLRQTIADTLGIGGIFRALRTIPVMLGIGRDMAELCPDAWLLNYTNPMAMLCQAYAHGSPHTKIVGLCHSIQHTTRQLAEYVGCPVRGGHLPRRRGQPPVVHPALRARRGGPLPAARRRHRGRPRAAPQGAGGALRALRLLPDRVERALGGVPAVADARRCGARALPRAGRTSTCGAASRTSSSTRS